MFDLLLRLITHNYIHGTKDSETLNCYLLPNAICNGLKENPFHCSEVYLQKSEKQINERFLKMSPVFFLSENLHWGEKAWEQYSLKVYIFEEICGKAIGEL